MDDLQKSGRVLVDFYGQGIPMYSVGEELYVAMKSVVEGMGLDWKSQHKKLVSEERYGYITIPLETPGGKQEVLCLPLKQLNGWLFSISPRKVKEDIRGRLRLYQDECCSALYYYWHKGQAVKPRSTSVLTLTAEHMDKEFKAALSLAETVGLTDAAAKIAANNVMKNLYGKNVLGLLEVDLVPEVQQQRYVPTEIARCLNEKYGGGFSAVTVNKLLKELGLQEDYRDHKGKKKWKLMEKALGAEGDAYAEYVSTGKEHSDGAPVLQIQWYQKALDTAIKEAAGIGFVWCKSRS